MTDHDEPTTTESDHASATGATARNKGVPQLRNLPQAVVERRVLTIARALIDGLGQSAIVQAVAQAQSKEVTERIRARASIEGMGQPVTADELESLVPTVWGDIPVPLRTLQRYIGRAKEALAAEGRRAGKNRDYILALQIGRLNEVYRGAVADKKWTAAVAVIREVNQMFGLYDAIKLMLIMPDGDAEKQQASGDNFRTPDGRAAVLERILATAAHKDPTLFGRIARYTSAEHVPAPLVAPNAGAASPAPPQEPTV